MNSLTAEGMRIIEDSKAKLEAFLSEYYALPITIIANMTSQDWAATAKMIDTNDKHESVRWINSCLTVYCYE